MKTAIRLLISLTFVLATFVQHSSASALEHFKFKGKSVMSIFTSTDGCIETQVFVAATQGVSRSLTGAGDPATEVALLILQLDICSDTRLVAAESLSTVPAADFQIDKKLAQATLNTTVTATDYAADPPASLDVFIDLTWTATGPLSRDNDNAHFQTPGCVINNRIHGTSRTAEASGSVSDGTTNYMTGPSTQALTMSSNNGVLIIGCTP